MWNEFNRDDKTTHPKTKTCPESGASWRICCRSNLTGCITLQSVWFSVENGYFWNASCTCNFEEENQVTILGYADVADIMEGCPGI